VKVAAVIPTWDARAAVLECLEALARSTHEATAIVVDNGSRDGTSETVRARFPRAELVELAENQGFARAVNLGIERALDLGVDAVLVLNNDARLEPEALARLVAALGPTVAIAAPRLEDASGRVWYAGGSFSRATARVRHARRSAREEIHPTGFAPLTAALVSRRALERTGLLDERFFLYYEDVDLALRVAEAGLAIVHVPAARGRHDVGLTARRRQVDRFAHETRSLLHLVAKHALFAALPALLVHHVLGHALLAVLRGEPAFVVGMVRGIGWFLAELRRPSSRSTARPRRPGVPSP
jgi:GT2 family glycosyltransferase